MKAKRIIPAHMLLNTLALTPSTAVATWGWFALEKIAEQTSEAALWSARIGLPMAFLALAYGVNYAAFKLISKYSDAFMLPASSNPSPSYSDTVTSDDGIYHGSPAHVGHSDQNLPQDVKQAPQTKRKPDKKSTRAYAGSVFGSTTNTILLAAIATYFSKDLNRYLKSLELNPAATWTLRVAYCAAALLFIAGMNLGMSSLFCCASGMFKREDTHGRKYYSNGGSHSQRQRLLDSGDTSEEESDNDAYITPRNSPKDKNVTYQHFSSTLETSTLGDYEDGEKTPPSFQGQQTSTPWINRSNSPVHYQQTPEPPRVKQEGSYETSGSSHSSVASI